MKLLDKCLRMIKEKGADEGEVSLTYVQKNEMNVHIGEISLLSSRDEYYLNLTAIIEQKKDFIQINKIDDKSIEEAVDELINNAKNSQVDEANVISSQPLERNFADLKGNLDLELMHRRLDEFINRTKLEYPGLMIEEAILEYQKRENYYQNTNDIKLSSNFDNYSFMVMFFSKRGKETSSFNHSNILSRDLEQELAKSGSLPYLMRESIEHLNARIVDNKKIEGDVIITPDCMNSLLYFLINHLQNNSLIAGTSYFTEKLNEKVLDDKFTLRTEADSEFLAIKNYYGGDGILNRNDYIFKNGVLKNYLLDLYGSKKTGFERGPSTGGNLIIDGGDESLAEMIKAIDRGIILSRFSGGQPATNGDFSGVAKNSYYVEDGELKYPIKETMVSGNLFNLLKNIKGISRERINFGYSLLPFIHSTDLIISSR